MALVMNNLCHDERETSEKSKQVNHFSHRHPLELSEVHEEDKAICSGCEVDIVGPCYVCSKPTCTFLLHDLCFDLPRRVRHHSHAKHPLALSISPPYSDGEFTCDACRRSGHGFTYTCGACKFDLHVECASLPEVEKRMDHLHPLILLAALPEEMDGRDLVCSVCDDPMVKGCWMYCCLGCKYATHLVCPEK